MIEKISAENACEAARYIMTEYYRLNVEPFFSVLSQNCVWILPGGQIVIGAEAIRAMFQDGFVMPPFQAEDVEFDLLNTGSPEQIGVFGTYSLFSDVESEMILAGKQRVTMMFRKEKDGFRLYHLHASNEWDEPAEGEIFPAQISRTIFKSSCRRAGRPPTAALSSKRKTPPILSTRIWYCMWRPSAKCVRST